MLHKSKSGLLHYSSTYKRNYLPVFQHTYTITGEKHNETQNVVHKRHEGERKSYFLLKSSIL